MLAAIVCLSVLNAGLIVLVWFLTVSFSDKIQDIAIFYGADSKVKEALAHSINVKKLKKSKKPKRKEPEPKEELEEEEVDYGNVRLSA